jgi:hypothetical protein
MIAGDPLLHMRPQCPSAEEGAHRRKLPPRSDTRVAQKFYGVD